MVAAKGSKYNSKYDNKSLKYDNKRFKTNFKGDKIIISTSVRINCDPKREKLIPIENNTRLIQTKSDSDLNSVV